MNKLFHFFSKDKLHDRSKTKIRIKLQTDELPYDIEIVAENLVVPWAMDISEDGTIYVTERPGMIRTIKDGRLNPQPLITFQYPFVSRVEGGLLGLALDPNFTQNHYIYVMYTYEEGSQLYNRVVRLIEQQDRAFVDTVLLDQIPGALIHDGGRLKIGPDQNLYITTGDAGNSSLAQDPSSLAGKILRIGLDGSIPEDNPIPGSPVYSLGLRNPQGITWNSSNIMYASDHGSEAHDEINIIQPGANYGWPLVQGEEDVSGVELQVPLVSTGNETWAPSGIAYIDQGPWQGKLLAANLRGQQLIAITLNNNGTEVKGIEAWLKNDYGRLRDVIQADDGSIYLSTSNRDGRGGIPNLGDDKIIRLIPKSDSSQ